MSEELVPPDFDQCQTERPNTWPSMATFMTLGPVSYKRCDNPPTWVAEDTTTGGKMSLCDECKVVMEGLFDPDQIKVEAVLRSVEEDET